MTNETEHIMQEGVSPEHRRRPELAGLYRPLDQQDKEWMVALGCNWSTETEEQDWLDKQNKLVTIGSIRQSAHLDFHTATVYQARKNFMKVLPVADAAYQIINKSMHDDGDGRETRRYIPTDGFVGTQRFLHGSGIDIQPLLNISPSVMLVRPESILDTLNHYGINAQKLFKNDPKKAISYSPKNISQKLLTMYAIARAWGWDDDISKQTVNPN